MQKDINDILPILFAGTVNGYSYFCQQTGLAPKDVKHVLKLDDLKGYQNKVLFYGPGFQWLPKDPDVFGYAVTHSIHLVDWPHSPFCFDFMNMVRKDYKA